MEMFSENNSNNNVAKGKLPFETALDKVGFGLYSWLLTALTGLTIIGFVCIVYSGTIVTQTGACELETTTAQQGLLVAAPVLAVIIGAVVWGYLADTYGRRSMALVSFCSAIILNCIASFSVNWVMLLVFQFIASFMASGQYSIIMSLLSECVPQARRNLVVLVVASIFLLAQGIMALMALPITHGPTDIPALNIQWNPWRTTLIIYCIPSILSCIWIFFMEESPKFVFVKKGEEEALNILRRIHRMNHYNSKEELQVKGLLSENYNEDGSTKQENKNVKELFKGKLLKYLIIMTSLQAFLQTGAFMLWLPRIADQFVETLGREDGGEGLTLCNLITASQDSNEPATCILNSTSLIFVFGVGVLQSLFNFVLLLVVGKFGRRNTVMLFAPICGVSGIIVNLIPNAIASLVFFVIFLLSILLLGLYTAITLALFPTHLRALAVSLTMAGGRIMLSIVAQILNLLFETKNNCDLAFYIFTSIVAASAMIAFFLPDERYLSQPKDSVKQQS